VSDDARITQQSRNVILGEGGDPPRIKSGEGSSKVLPLAEDSDPGQPGLERLESHPLVEPLHAGDRPALLIVVIGQIFRG
jgi:hypothetical protein